MASIGKGWNSITKYSCMKLLIWHNRVWLTLHFHHSLVDLGHFFLALPVFFDLLFSELFWNFEFLNSFKTFLFCVNFDESIYAGSKLAHRLKLWSGHSSFLVVFRDNFLAGAFRVSSCVYDTIRVSSVISESATFVSISVSARTYVSGRTSVLE